MVFATISDILHYIPALKGVVALIDWSRTDKHRILTINAVGLYL